MHVSKKRVLCYSSLREERVGVRCNELAQGEQMKQDTTTLTTLKYYLFKSD